MFLMYDSVDLAQVPKQPHAVACYMNGAYANKPQAERWFPNARLLTISVTGRVVADCYDVETGDYTPRDVQALYEDARAHGIERPCFYADLSNMPHVQSALHVAGAPRSTYRLWVAYYNGRPDLPENYDAHQFTDRALGRNLDESICADDFFPPAKSEALAEHNITHAYVTLPFTVEGRPFVVTTTITGK